MCKTICIDSFWNLFIGGLATKIETDKNTGLIIVPKFWHLLKNLIMFSFYLLPLSKIPLFKAFPVGGMHWVESF